MSGLTKFDIVKAEINLRNEVERMFGKIKWDTPTDAYDAAVSDEANMNYSIWAKLYGMRREIILTMLVIIEIIYL